MTANWGVHVFHATWQSGLVALLAIAVARSFPRLSSRFRYSLLGIAMIKFALPPMLTLPVGAFSALPDVGSPFFWRFERPFVLGAPRLMFALMMIHGAGALVAAVLLIARAARMHRLIRAGRFDGGLVTSAATSIPFVYGVMRPVIVLPASIAPEQREDVLAHERMHLVQNDSRHAAFQSVLAIVWWWNPLFWLLSAEWRRVREERCDDAVLAAGHASPWSYSRSIIDVAAAAATLAGVPMAEHPLEPRLRRLADKQLSRTRRMSAMQIAAIVLAALIVLPGVGRGASHGRQIHIHIH
jgi:hypothetical protein